MNTVNLSGIAVAFLAPDQEVVGSNPGWGHLFSFWVEIKPLIDQKIQKNLRNAML